MTKAPQPRPTTYVIRVAGRLPLSRQPWFEGLSINHRPDGTTELSGPIVDQAQLHGLLAKVRDLNVTLLSVTTGAFPADSQEVDA